MQKVSIIGLGYVGLPLALAIEKSKKYDVVVDGVNKLDNEKFSKSGIIYSGIGW